MAHAPRSATGIDAVSRPEGTNVLVPGGISGIGRAIPGSPRAVSRTRRPLLPAPGRRGHQRRGTRSRALYQVQPGYLGFSAINGAVQTSPECCSGPGLRYRPSVRIPRTLNVLPAVFVAGQSRDHRDGMRDLVWPPRHNLCGDRRPDVPDRPRLNQE
jgi:hypothetical protein